MSMLRHHGARAAQARSNQGASSVSKAVELAWVGIVKWVCCVIMVPGRPKLAETKVRLR